MNCTIKPDPDIIGIGVTSSLAFLSLVGPALSLFTHSEGLLDSSETSLAVMSFSLLITSIICAVRQTIDVFHLVCSSYMVLLAGISTCPQGRGSMNRVQRYTVIFSHYIGMCTLTAFISFILWSISSFGSNRDCNDEVLVDLFFVNVKVANIVFRWALGLSLMFLFFLMALSRFYPFGPVVPIPADIKIAHRIFGNIIARSGIICTLALTILQNPIGNEWLAFSFAQMYAVVASSGALLDLVSTLQEEQHLSIRNGWHDAQLKAFGHKFIFRVADPFISALAAISAASVAFVMKEGENPTQQVLRTAALAGMLIGAINSFTELVCSTTGDAVPHLAKLPASVIGCFITTYWTASNHLTEIPNQLLWAAFIAGFIFFLNSVVLFFIEIELLGLLFVITIIPIDIFCGLSFAGYSKICGLDIAAASGTIYGVVISIYCYFQFKYFRNRFNHMEDERERLARNAHKQLREAISKKIDALTRQMRSRLHLMESLQTTDDIQSGIYMADLEEGGVRHQNALRGEAEVLQEQAAALAGAEYPGLPPPTELTSKAEHSLVSAKTINEHYPAELRISLSKQAEFRLLLRVSLESQNALVNRLVQIQRTRKGMLDSNPKDFQSVANSFQQTVLVNRQWAHSLTQDSNFILGDSQTIKSQAGNINRVREPVEKQILRQERESQSDLGSPLTGQGAMSLIEEAYRTELESCEKEVPQLKKVADAKRQASQLIQTGAEAKRNESDALNDRLQFLLKYINVASTSSRPSWDFDTQMQLTTKQKDYLQQQAGIYESISETIHQKKEYMAEHARTILSQADCLRQKKAALKLERDILSKENLALERTKNYAFRLTQKSYLDRRLEYHKEQILGLELQESGLRKLGRTIGEQAESLPPVKKALKELATAVREEADATELEVKSIRAEAEADGCRSSAELVSSWGRTSNALNLARIIVR